MKSNWPTKKLGEVCRFQFGFTFRASEFNDIGKGLPVIRIGDIDKGVTEKFFDGKYDRRFLVKKGDILIGLSGTIKVAKWNGDDALLNQRVVKLNNFEGILPDYLYFALPQALRKLEEELSGVVVKNVLLSHLENLQISLPPIEEQKRIVAKIEKIFAKIDEAERLRAESASASAALLPSALHQIFTKKHSNILQNMRMLSEVAEINPLKSEVNGMPENIEVSFVPMSAVNETTQTIEEQKIRKLKEVKKGYTYFKNGDVLFAKITPCMENGKVAIAENLKNGIGFGSTEFHVVRAKEKVLPKWLFYFLWNPAYREEAKKNMTGTAGQQRVPADFLKNSKIPLPPLSEQKKIVAYLDNLSAKARQLQTLQSQTAADFAALRRSVLAELMKAHELSR